MALMSLVFGSLSLWTAAPDLVVLERATAESVNLVTYRLPGLERVRAVPLHGMSPVEDLRRATLSEDGATIVLYGFERGRGYRWIHQRVGARTWTEIPPPDPWRIADVVPKGDSLRALLYKNYTRFTARTFRKERWLGAPPEKWLAETSPPAEFPYPRAAMRTFPHLGELQFGLLPMQESGGLSEWQHVFGVAGGEVRGTLDVASGDILVQLIESARGGARFVRRVFQGPNHIYYLPEVRYGQQLRIRGAHTVVRYEDLVYLLPTDGENARTVPGSLIVDVVGK